MEDRDTYGVGYQDGWQDCSRATWRFIGTAVILVGAAVAAFWLCGKSNGQELPRPLITDVARIASPNRDDYGICWWCCAEMLGKHFGIIPLETLTKKVVKTEIGFKQGAGSKDIHYWTKKLGLVSDYKPRGNTDVEWVKAKLTDGLPVISSHHWFGGGNHAILIVAIGNEKVTFTLPRSKSGVPGKTVTDYPVRYINPSHVDRGIVTRDYTWFMETRTGKACTFDPRKQRPELVRKTAEQPISVAPKVVQLYPGRLMFADMQFHPVAPAPVAQKKPQGKRYAGNDKQAAPVKVITEVTPDIEVRQESPPYFPHQLPYRADFPAYEEYVVLPSNQDIKDGINRPDDTVRYGCYYFYTPEYLKSLPKAKVKEK